MSLEMHRIDPNEYSNFKLDLPSNQQKPRSVHLSTEYGWVSKEAYDFYTIPYPLLHLLQTKHNTKNKRLICATSGHQTSGGTCSDSLRIQLRLETFTVYENNVAIGWINCNRKHSKLELRSQFTKTPEGKKLYISTSSPKRLVNAYEKYVRTPTFLEEADKLRQFATRDMRNLNLEHSQRFSSKVPVFADALLPYIMDNFDKYKDIAMQAGVKEADIDIALSTYTQRNVVQQICKTKNGDGSFVYNEDDDWLFIHPTTGGKKAAYLTSSLPQDTLEKIGMLKMGNNSSFLKDVGYKHNDNFFFITGAIDNE